MRLLADIGGTHARFALVDRTGAIHTRRVLPVRDHARFEDALTAFAEPLPAPPVRAALSVAGPVIDHAVDMTNANWRISADAVHSVLPGIPVRIVNDLAAVALAVPAMTADDVATLRVGQPATNPEPVLCINLGTGFGAALAVPIDGMWHALATEAGHMTLATCSETERSLLGNGKTVEQVFSGPGLRALREQTGGTPADGFRVVYSRVLGRLAGDLALGTGAWGGVMLCGGVLDAFDTVIDRAAFLGGMDDRSGLAKRLATIPVCRITRDDPALLGLLQLTAQG